MPSITWERLPIASTTEATTAIKRSSNSVAVVGDNAYLFGGEAVPRKPVDAELSILDLTTGSISTAPSLAHRPSPRVGSSLVSHGNDLFLWGGREGEEMQACDGTLWKYSLQRRRWASVTPDGDLPEERSYHCMAMHGDELYLHAGCPAKGRLETLHSLSLSDPTWTSQEPAPPPGRGGTVLCSVTVSSGKSLLVRFGGFAGHELGGAIDKYDPSTREWKATPIPKSGPQARSVHALLPLNIPAAFDSSATPIAVLLFGEREPAPAELGHEGAGQFHSDAWLLVSSPTDDLSFVPLTQEGACPPARGWFASAAWKEGKVVVVGGLDDANKRLNDVWVGQVQA